MNKTCFVIMPFGEKQNEYYNSIYIPAINDTSLKPIRVDDLSTPSPILNDIWHQILSAEIILADITGLNPNVMYELGLAHAALRPVIMVTNSIDSVPFDLRSLRIIEYDNSRPRWDTQLQQKISTAISKTLKSPLETILPTFIERRPDKQMAISELKSDIIEIKQMLFNQFDRLTKTSNGKSSENKSLTADEYYDAKAYARKLYFEDGLSISDIKASLSQKYHIIARVASDIFDKAVWQ